MIFKGAETPYAQRQNKTPDMSAGTLVTSDAVLNKDITYLITESVKSQTLIQIIKNIVGTDKVDEVAAISMIGAVLGVK